MTRAEKSPRAIASVAATISRSGEVRPRASTHTTPRATSPTSTPATDGQMPTLRPMKNTPTVTATAARMMTLIFSFSVGSGSSGRSGVRGRFTCMRAASSTA